MRKFAVSVVYKDPFARDRLHSSLYHAFMAEALVETMMTDVALSAISVQQLRDILDKNVGSFESGFRNAEARLLVGADTESNDLLATIDTAIRKSRRKDKTTQIITLADAIARKCGATRARQFTLKVVPTQEIDRDVISRLKPQGITVQCAFAEGEDALELYTRAAFSWARRQALSKK